MSDPYTIPRCSLTDDPIADALNRAAGIAADLEEFEGSRTNRRQNPAYVRRQAQRLQGELNNIARACGVEIVG